MRADELLERGDLLRLGIEEADDRDIAHVVDRVEALEGGDGVLTVDRERVLALDAALFDEVDAVPADADEAVRGGADHEDADAGMVREGLDEVRVGLLDRLERQPLLADVEVDERQVAAGDDDEVGGLDLLVIGALRSLPVARALPSGSPRRPADPSRPRRPSCCRARRHARGIR